MLRPGGGVLNFHGVRILTLFSESCALIGRGADGVHQGRPESAFLKFMNAFNGCTAGTTNGVFQYARMLSGLEYHLGGTEQCLGRQSSRDIPRKAGGHAAIAEGFDDLKNVGGAAAAQPGHGIEQFLLHFEGEPDAPEEALSELTISRRGR